jgi:ubiquitin-conjugating enzyme E2 A
MFHPNVRGFEELPAAEDVAIGCCASRRRCCCHSPDPRSPQTQIDRPCRPPQIFPDGTLCLDIIQDKWKPIYTVSTILTSIQSLLCDPNNDSPANVDAAKLLKTNPKEYKKRVRRLAQKSVEG